MKNACESEGKSTNWLSVKLEKKFEQPETTPINIKVGNIIIETMPGFDTDHLIKLIRTLS
jgi:hypothetical protein